MAATLTAGQAHESTQVASLLDQVAIRNVTGQTRRHPIALAGDKGYSYPRVRHLLGRRRIVAVIPRRSDQQPRPGRGRHRPFDAIAYRRRNVIERCVGWLKERRRLGTRFDKLAVNFLAMIQLGFVLHYLRKLFSYRT